MSKNKDDIWKEDCIRYLGFMDIMGFKNMVERKSHSDVKALLEQLSNFNASIESVVGRAINELTGEKDEPRIKSITFSDSILFITKEDTITDLKILCALLSIFQEASIHRGAPTKGAISVGMFTANFDKNIFFGQPLIDAYLLQDELFYYGVILDNLVESRVVDYSRSDNIDKEEFKLLLSKLPTPLKGGLITHYNLKLNSVTDEQLEDLYSKVSGKVRRYVDNTVSIYQEMNK